MAEPVDKHDPDPFGPFTVAEVEQCFQAFDLDENGFVGASELRKFCYNYIISTTTMNIPSIETITQHKIYNTSTHEQSIPSAG